MTRGNTRVVHLGGPAAASALASYLERLRDQFPTYARALASISAVTDPFTTLTELPEMDAAAYASVQNDALARVGRRAFTVDHTSGTTAQFRKLRLASSLDDEAEAALCHDAFRLWGITAGDRVLALDIDSSQIYLFYGRVLRQLGAQSYMFAAVGAGAPAAARIQRLIANYQPTIIISVPSVMSSLLRRLEEARACRLPAVPRAILIGEPTHPELRSYLRDTLSCEAFSLYGSTEIGSVAAECRMHDGLHIDVERVLPTIKVTRSGAGTIEGEVLWTTMHFADLPLIKFPTHDLIRVSLEACRCGRTEPRIVSVRRIHDEVVLFGYKIPYENFRQSVSHLLLATGFLQISVSQSTGPVVLTFVVPSSLAPKRRALQEALFNVDDLRDLIDRGFLRAELEFSDEPMRTGRKIRNVIDTSVSSPRIDLAHAERTDRDIRW